MAVQQQIATNGPVRYMQGIAVPQESVRPDEFFARTRRHINLEKATNWQGFGGTETIELKKADILGGLQVRFTGSLVITPGTGTVASTARWPYDLVQNFKFTANGQSNLVQSSGLKVKVREFIAKGDLNDRGVQNTVGGAVKSQGTLSKASESWGVGSNTSAIAAGTYNVDLEWYIPVAEDLVDLAGAIFCASSSTDLTLNIVWEQLANLFALTGNATVAMNNGFLAVTATKFSVPLGADGEIVIPDLSIFHSFIQSSTKNALGTGENEVRMIGQGAGKTLLRIIYQLWNGAGTASAPLAMTSANFGKQAYRYAGNETPDEFYDGGTLRYFNERTYSTDVGGVWGFGVHEFAQENAFRDTIDMGTTSELRTVVTVQNSVALANSAFEYVQETIFQAGAGA